MRGHPTAWKELVRGMIVCESTCDQKRHQIALGGPAGASAALKCGECQVGFPTQRALKMHCRVVHSLRCVPKAYAPGSGQCMLCLKVFSTRLRLIAHLTETRQRGPIAPCGLRLGCVAPLPAREVARLDELDREARRAARRKGLTQPRSRGLVRSGESDEEIPSPKRFRISSKQAPGALATKRQRVSL